MSRSPKILVAGLGSPHGDDRAGWLVVEELKRQYGDRDGVVIRRASIPLDVLDWIDGMDVLHICDACETTSSRRGFHRLVWNTGQIINSCHAGNPEEAPTLMWHKSRGSHDFELPDVLRLAETTHQLPGKVIIWAIDGRCFQPEDVMNDATRIAALQTTNEIYRELKSFDA